MRGQFVAQLLGDIVLVADHGDAVWRERPTSVEWNVMILVVPSGLTTVTSV